MTNRPWGSYTLTITDKDNRIVLVQEYTNTSGHEMMNSDYSWQQIYPKSEGYKINW
jgi:hypothetical protein